MTKSRVVVGMSWMTPAIGLVLLACSVPMSVVAQNNKTAGVFLVTNRSGRVLFRVSLMNADGSHQTSLSEPPQMVIDADPAWSPDGKKIAFASALISEGKKGKWDIYTMNADGSERRLLIQMASSITSPTWSPDGKQIAFSYADHEDDIYIINADGSGLKRIGHGRMPKWSPDGKSILYFTTVNSQLYLMDRDGQNVRALTSGGPAVMGSWSPDGKRIAYLLLDEISSGDIFVMNADGSERKRLTSTEDSDMGPEWSADGKRIFFTRIPKETSKRMDRFKCAVCVMDQDGQNVKQLTNYDVINMMPTGSSFFVTLAFLEAEAAP